MADLEPELRALGATLAVPGPPDVRAAVRARIAAPHRPGVRRPVTRWAVAALIALATAVAISPQGRAAVADLLRFAGVEIRWGSDNAPATPQEPLPGQHAVSLDAARQLADFPVGVPARLGTPDRVLVADSARVVSLVYGSGVDRVRLDEFDGRLEPAFVKSVTGVVYVEIGSAAGWWLPGPHAIRYVDRNGVVREETARLAGRTLLWESDGVTYRLEGQLSRAEAMTIAASVQ